MSRKFYGLNNIIPADFKENIKRMEELVGKIDGDNDPFLLKPLEDGTAGQVLGRDEKGNTDWIDPPMSYPDNGTPGQVLTYNPDGSVSWKDLLKSFPDQGPESGTAGQVLVKGENGEAIWKEPVKDEPLTEEELNNIMAEYDQNK